MSVRVVLEALRAHGGQASVTELKEAHYLASTRCLTLLKQGVVERVEAGVYRLKEA